MIFIGVKPVESYSQLRQRRPTTNQFIKTTLIMVIVRFLGTVQKCEAQTCGLRDRGRELPNCGNFPVEGVTASHPLVRKAAAEILLSNE